MEVAGPTMDVMVVGHPKPNAKLLMHPKVWETLRASNGWHAKEGWGMVLAVFYWSWDSKPWKTSW